MTRGELISQLAALLGARHEARIIVEEVLGSTRGTSGQVVDTTALRTARSLAARRQAGEPLQYALGHWAFRTLDLLVDPRVLIPRPETEQVTAAALDEIRRHRTADPVIVDAGTGSGAIALSLAAELVEEFPEGCLWATDTSADALAVAGANLGRIRRQHCGAVLPVTFLRGSWLEPLPSSLHGSVDLIVSNPPYVATGEWLALADEVRREPRAALVATDGTDGTPGLRDVEEVLSQAGDWLGPRGAVVVELAPHQADAAVVMACGMGYRDVRVECDLAQRPRTLIGRRR